MAKASDQLTIFYVIDVKASYRYYLLQDSTTDKPSKPTTYPPPSTWSSTEPTYTSGSTKKLYLVDCVVFNNNTFIYSDVSLSSSYEAAKAAYTKATSVEARITSAETQIEQNKNDITLRAIKTETDAKIKVESDKITSAVSRISANESSISTLEQTANGLNVKIDALEFGGTNLLRGTGNISPLTSPATWANAKWRSGGTTTTGTTKTVVDVSDVPNGNIKKGFKISVTTAGDNNVAQDAVPVLIGKQYILSCYAKGTGTLRLQVGKSPYSSISYTLSSVANWTRYTYIFTAGDGNGASGNNTNVYLSNRGVGDLYICGMKLEKGNRATDWSPAPQDVTDASDEAAKTATNYLDFSSSGLVVGDMTASSLGRNVLIDSDSVDIRNGSTVLASFGETLIELGKKASESVISFCGGNATMTATKESSGGYYDGIRMDATTLKMYGKNLYFHSTMDGNTDNYNRIMSTTRSSDNTISNDIDTLMKYDGKQYNSYLTTYSSADSSEQATWASLHSDHYTGSSWKRNWLKVTPTETTLSDMSNSGLIRPWQKTLWSGSYFLNDSQTVTLSEAISAQPNGIVLVWSYYSDGASENSNFSTYFIPKHFVSLHGGRGISIFISNSSASIVATKYVYVSDTQLTGHSNNNAAAASKSSGVTISPRYFVLRYVIGV